MEVLSWKQALLPPWLPCAPSQQGFVAIVYMVTNFVIFKLAIVYMVTNFVIFKLAIVYMVTNFVIFKLGNPFILLGWNNSVN